MSENRYQAMRMLREHTANTRHELIEAFRRGEITADEALAGVDTVCEQTKLIEFLGAPKTQTHPSPKRIVGSAE